MRGIHRSLVNSPSQRPVTRSFGGFFDLRLNKRLSKQSRRRWFETLSRSLWCHCNVTCWILWGNISKYWHCIFFIPTGTCLGNGLLHYKGMQGQPVFRDINVKVDDEPGHQQPSCRHCLPRITWARTIRVNKYHRMTHSGNSDELYIWVYKEMLIKLQFTSRCHFDSLRDESVFDFWVWWWICLSGGSWFVQAVTFRLFGGKPSP